MPESTNNPDVRCATCQTLNGRFESFCRNCGSPISATATLTPVSIVQTEGLLFRKALDYPPGPIVLIGIWLLFLPMFVFGVYLAISVIFTQHGLLGFFSFWMLVGMSYIAFMFLYRFTKKYIVARRSL